MRGNRGQEHLCRCLTIETSLKYEIYRNGTIHEKHNARKTFGNEILLS